MPKNASHTQNSVIQQPKLLNNPAIIEFIHQNSDLFWYTPEDKKESISDEILLETILNYGDLNAVKQLLSLWGINQTAIRFEKLINKSDRRKGNFHELTLNFFKEFFKRHAHRDI
jgi:hypothetical protein